MYFGEGGHFDGKGFGVCDAVGFYGDVGGVGGGGFWCCHSCISFL